MGTGCEIFLIFEVKGKNVNLRGTSFEGRLGNAQDVEVLSAAAVISNITYVNGCFILGNVLPIGIDLAFQEDPFCDFPAFWVKPEKGGILTVVMRPKISVPVNQSRTFFQILVELEGKQGAQRLAILCRTSRVSA